MKVVFPCEVIENTNKTKYPDDISMFSNTDIETKPGFIIAEYSGGMNLLEYEPDKEKIKIITEHHFRNRFTMAERMAFDNSIDPLMVTIRADLRAASVSNGGIVNLEYQPVIDGVHAMVGIGILADQARVNEILTIQER